MDVVLTATLRPELIDITLRSFFNNLISQSSDVRLILNIDPVGSRDCAPEDIINICRRYIREIFYRCPDQPSFSRAVRWCWEQVETDYFLHLEDDWLLRKRVSLQPALDLFTKDPDIASVRFNRSVNSDEEPVMSPYFSLNPSIIRKKFIDEALPHFSSELDPEKQFCVMEGEKEEALSHWKFACYGAAGDTPYVIDIGRLWRKFMNLGKWEQGSSDITWKHRNMTRYRFAHYLRYKTSIWYWRYLL